MTPEMQSRIYKEAIRTAAKSEEAKRNGTAGNVFLQNKDGSYLTYSHPDETAFQSRGGMCWTPYAAKAFNFGLVEAAEAEVARAQSKLKNCTIVQMDEVPEMTEEEKTEEAGTAVSVKKAKRKCFNTEIRKMVYRKTEGHCYLCGDFVDYEEFEIEHRVPLAKGGTNDFSNLFCSCHKCNSMKGSIAPEDLMERVTKIFMHQVREACGDDHAKMSAIEASLAMAGIRGRN